MAPLLSRPPLLRPQCYQLNTIMLEVFKQDNPADGMRGSTPLDAVAERSHSYGRIRRHGCRGATNMKGTPCEPDAVADC